MRLPPLMALRAFDAVGRLGSLRLAAEDLSLHHTVVGRHVRKLENWLGEKLVDNSHSETRLTEAGRRYHAQTTAALAAISDATETFRPTGIPQIKVWVGPGLNLSWLMPRMEHINAAAKVEIVLLRATDHLPDFRRYEADVAIHYGHEYVPASNSVELFQPRMIPVASASFLANNPITNVSDLLKAPLLLEQSSEWWTLWFRANGLEVGRSLPGPKLGYAHVTIGAAKLGRGVALANEVIVAPDIESGDLVEVLPSDIRIEHYVFYAAKSRWNEPGISRLRQYLLEHLAAPIPHGGKAVRSRRKRAAAVLFSPESSTDVRNNDDQTARDR